jgi:hypothetical protein
MVVAGVRSSSSIRLGTKQELAMTVKCFVFRPGEGSPEIYKFVTLPRVGEEITLPDHIGDFVVESIAHMAREAEDTDRPTVQMNLGTLNPKEVHRPIGFLVN